MRPESKKIKKFYRLNSQVSSLRRGWKHSIEIMHLESVHTLYSGRKPKLQLSYKSGISGTLNMDEVLQIKLISKDSLKPRRQ